MLPIKEDDESFLKIVTKENSIANPSFRVYYGGNEVAVPFVWEATPGTPKHTKHNNNNNLMEENKHHHLIHLPPLTPPPSYYLKQPNKTPSSGGSKKFSTSKILQVLFPKRSLHRRQVSSTPSFSSSTLSCPSSSVLIPDSTMRSSEQSRSLSLRRRSRSRRTLSTGTPGSLFDLMVSNGNHQENDEQEEQMRSPRSVLCFGFGGSRRIRTSSVV